MTEAPFDRLAADYDRRWALTTVGTLQRHQVWQRVDHLWCPGEKILELGCGTGLDALHLAGLGLRVLATDPSTAMIEKTRLRCAGQPAVEARPLRAEQILDLSETFDGVFSNFAALNCVLDLDAFAAALTERLRAGGFAVFCLFGRYCAWEILGYGLRGRPREAVRRLRRGIVDASIGSGRSIQVRYYSPTEMRRAFGAAFEVISLSGIGIGVPPTYLHLLVQRWPGLFGFGHRLDLRFGSLWPVNQLGDHVLYVLRRRQEKSNRGVSI